MNVVKKNESQTLGILKSMSAPDTRKQHLSLILKKVFRIGICICVTLNERSYV